MVSKENTEEHPHINSINVKTRDLIVVSSLSYYEALSIYLIRLHLDRIAKAIVFRCSDTDRLSLLLFANSNSRSIDTV